MKLLKFPKNFKPIFVDWAITTKCYLNCTHCRYHGKNNATETQTQKSKVKSQKSKVELSNTEAIKLAKEIGKLKPQWILIEGGEPFLRKDLFDIIKILKPRMDTNKHGLRIMKPRMDTNIPNSSVVYNISSGMGFNERLAKKCQESGVKIMISLDSAIENTYQKIRVGARLSDAINAIKIAQRFGILDSINVTLQELNASIKEIKAIGKLANELQVKSINFLGFKPNSACATKSLLVAKFDKIFSEIVNIGNKYKINVKVDEPFFKPWTKTTPNVFARCFSTPTKQSPTFEIATPPKGRLAMTSDIFQNGPIVAEEKSGCIFGEYLFIEPNGTLKPCSFSPLSFAEIGWKMIKKIQHKKNRQGKCGKCEYQLECGGCRVRTYALTGNWLETDPYCTV